MVRGLYTAGWGLVANTKKLDVISNNLANVNTGGFKKDIVVYETFASYMAKRINDPSGMSHGPTAVGPMEFGSDIGEIYTVYTQGKLINTGATTDLAIKNNDRAFFAVEVPSPDGTVREMYTRNGAFAVDMNGRLVTQDGYAVKGLVNGEEGPVILNNDDFIVENDGTVIQDGEVVAVLIVREFENTDTLRKHGDNLVERTDDTQEVEFSGDIQQGCLEESNVNPVKEMVDIITAMRLYEANQKVLRAYDDTLDKAVNEVAVVR